LRRSIFEERIGSLQGHKRPEVLERILELIEERSKRVALTADDILRHIGDTLNFDMTDLMCEDFTLDVLKLRDMPPAMRRLIKTITRTYNPKTDSDTVRIEVVSKENALGLAFKHLGMTHTSENPQMVTIEDLINKAKESEE
jgi:hypothetical protein